jgi:uncharacterized membrane protein
MWHLSRMRTWGIVVVPFLAALGSLAAPAMAQGFAPGAYFYPSPAGYSWTYAPAIASDGSAAGGYVRSTSNFQQYGAIATPSGLTVFPEPSRVYDIADNAAYTVGYVTRRAPDGSVDQLASVTQPQNSFGGANISGNGQIVAGTIESATNGNVIFAAHPYIWTPTSGTVHLGRFNPTAELTHATNLSHDGSTIVGWAQDHPFADVFAWRWTQANGYQVLPDAPGAPFQYAQAWGANADASIIVGQGMSPSSRAQALVWRDGVPSVLPPVEGYRDTIARGVTDDGSMIIGTLAGSLVGLRDTAAIWTAETNWVPLLDFIRSKGFDIPDYYAAPFDVMRISADGRTISGLVSDTRNNTRELLVVSIPSPSGLALLVLSSAFTRRARARR